MLEVLDPDRLEDPRITKSMILPDVLCPWGCSEFCFRTTELNPGLLLQHHLRKVQLNLLQQEHQKIYSVDSSRLDYIRRDDEDLDYVLLNRDWPILPSVRLSAGGGLIVCTCRHHGSILNRKRLMPHPPRKPHSDPLSSVRTDQLCQASMRSFMKPAVKKGCNTVPSLNTFSITYQGGWSSDVSIDNGFDNWGERRMSHRHECLSLHRPDIRQIGNLFVNDGRVSSELFKQWDDEYNSFSRTMLKSLTRGATYTPSINAIILQKTSNQEFKVKIKDYRKCSNEDDLTELKTMFLGRSWCPTIYNMQVEEPDRYGCRMVGIEPMHLNKKNRQASNMLTWAIIGLVSSCKELYHALDQRVDGHASNNLSGHVLSYIHHKYMKHCTSMGVRQSPFKTSMPSHELCKIVYSSLSAETQSRSLEYSEDRAEDYFLFGCPVFRDLFPPGEYPSVSVVESLNDPNLGNVNSKDIVILISDQRPNGCATIEIGSEKFEARVLLGVAADKTERHKFSGTRFARHGAGYKNWWSQDRSGKFRDRCFKQIMTQHTRSLLENEQFDEYPILPSGMFRYVTVFVKVKEFQVEAHKLDMMKSLGIQCSLLCGCRSGEENPLIIGGIRKDSKRECMTPGCDKLETYMCPASKCRSRVCTECFKKLTCDGRRLVLNKDEQTNAILTGLDVNDSEEGSLDENGAKGDADGLQYIDEVDGEEDSCCGSSVESEENDEDADGLCLYDTDNDEDSGDGAYGSGDDGDDFEDGNDHDLERKVEATEVGEVERLVADRHTMRTTREIGYVRLPHDYLDTWGDYQDGDPESEVESEISELVDFRAIQAEGDLSKLDLAKDNGTRFECGREHGVHYDPR